jgi:hypothetical protein
MAVLGLPNPALSAADSFRASLEATQELAETLRLGTPLDTAHYTASAESRGRASRKAREEAEAAVFEGLVQGARPNVANRLKRSRGTGAWLTTTPEYLNGTDLSAEEFRDSLRLRLGLQPASLPQLCDGCGERFSVEHAMSCKKGGLVVQRHNAIVAEWMHLCSQALTASAVTPEPLIHTGLGQSTTAAPAQAAPETRGDVAAHGFWHRGNTTIFDVRITDLDAGVNRGRDSLTILRKHEREKKLKHGPACLERRRHFTPLVFSVDGLRAPETEAACKRLASLLSSKWKRPYAELCGFVRSRLSIALARSASRCIRAERGAPARRTPAAVLESGEGLALYS